MQDETLVEVIQGLDAAWAWIEHLPQGDTAQEHLNAIDAARDFLLAFAAPPAGEIEAVAVRIAQERHGSHDEHPTLYAACYEGVLAALSHPLPADREAIAREALAVADAWDAHCMAVERCNAAIPAIDGTRAERAVYDEHYRASEQAKRDMYSAAQTFAKWASDNRAILALSPTSSAGRDGSGA